MNNFLFLAIFCVGLWIYILKKTSGEIFSCSALTAITVAVGVCLLYIQSLVWHIGILDKTTMLLSLGLFSAAVGDLFAFYLYKRKNVRGKIKCDNIVYWKVRFLKIICLFYVLATFLYAHEITKLGQSLGFDDLSAIGEVKANMKELYMNPLIKQMYKLVTAGSYIHSLIFANNVFLAHRKVKKECMHLVPFICTIIITLASGGRLNIFKVMVGFLLISYLILRESSNWRKLYISKIVKIGIPLFLVFVLLFSAVSLIVKNNASNREKVETFEYISYYAGSPIQVFNLRVADGRDKWKYERFGNYTLSGLYDILGFDGDIKSTKIGNGMMYLGGNSGKAGNAHTAFCSAYLDFGTFGMAIFMFLTYFLFGRYYYKNIVTTYSSYLRNKRLLIYVYCYVSVIVLAFYDGCYYILLSTTGLLTLLVLLVMYWFYFKKLIVVSQLKAKNAAYRTL